MNSIEKNYNPSEELIENVLEYCRKSDTYIGLFFTKQTKHVFVGYSFNDENSPIDVYTPYKEGEDIISNLQTYFPNTKWDEINKNEVALQLDQIKQKYTDQINTFLQLNKQDITDKLNRMREDQKEWKLIHEYDNFYRLDKKFNGINISGIIDAETGGFIYFKKHTTGLRPKSRDPRDDIATRTRSGPHNIFHSQSYNRYAHIPDEKTVYVPDNEETYLQIMNDYGTNGIAGSLVQSRLRQLREAVQFEREYLGDLFKHPATYFNFPNNEQAILQTNPLTNNSEARRTISENEINEFVKEYCFHYDSDSVEHMRSFVHELLTTLEKFSDNERDTLAYDIRQKRRRSLAIRAINERVTDDQDGYFEDMLYDLAIRAFDDDNMDFVFNFFKKLLPQ